jgi:hypothetical protein
VPEVVTGEPETVKIEGRLKATEVTPLAAGAAQLRFPEPSLVRIYPEEAA